jgi:hypothetical protein
MSYLIIEHTQQRFLLFPHVVGTECFFTDQLIIHGCGIEIHRVHHLGRGCVQRAYWIVNELAEEP